MMELVCWNVLQDSTVLLYSVYRIYFPLQNLQRCIMFPPDSLHCLLLLPHLLYQLPFHLKFDRYVHKNDRVQKNDGATSIIEEKNEVESIDADTITSGSKTRLEDAVNAENSVLDSRDDSKAIGELTQKFNTAEDQVNYYAYAQNGYGDASNSKVLKKGYSTLLDKTLYENDTNSSVSADTFSEAYIGLLYARNEVVTKAEFTELTNQFAEAQKEAAGVAVGNKEGEYAQETVVAFKKTLEELSVQADETKITKTELTQLSTK